LRRTAAITLCQLHSGKAIVLMSVCDTSRVEQEGLTAAPSSTAERAAERELEREGWRRFFELLPGEPIVGLGLKMFLGYAASLSQLRLLAKHADEFKGVALFVLPSFPVLAEARLVLNGSGIAYGAQDGHWEDSGPHTGSVSPAMLKELGCAFMEVGHAERRRWFGEDDAMVARKVAAAVRNGLVPIICVGEPHQASDAVDLVVGQVRAALARLPRPNAPVILAYEPVWKIGADSPAQADRIAGVVSALRSTTAHTGSLVRVLYGGSVAPGQIRPLLRTGIDGIFVGRAAVEFGSLRQIVAEIRENV
jgi:triosephosphate isomerase